jgi:hypothetical protein
MRFITGILCALLASTPGLANEDTGMDLNPNWEYVADTVMGGVSSGGGKMQTFQGRRAARLQGNVSLDNNGGFIQLAFDVQPDGKAFDANGFEGIEMDVYGNGEVYDLRLRTNQLRRPWQSFRTDFEAPAEWTTIKVPFDAFISHKTDAVFDPARLRRVGILAIGREFQADIAVANVRLY